jgi:hypothetical protein
MTRENIAHVQPPGKLTDEQAVTLRRIAFGESEVRSLRPADLERLLELRLIAHGADGLELTDLGRDCFDSLPRGVFASRQYRRDHG